MTAKLLRGPIEARLPAYLARCREGDGGCLLWPGVLDHGVPSVCCGGRRMSLRRLVLQAQLGRPLKPGCVPVAACGDGRCLAAEHLRELTHRKACQHAARPLNMDHRRRIAAAKQAASKTLDWPRVREIRARLCAGEPERQVAADYNISRRLAGLIKHGQVWRETTPFSV